MLSAAAFPTRNYLIGAFTTARRVRNSQDSDQMSMSMVCGRSGEFPNDEAPSKLLIADITGSGVSGEIGSSLYGSSHTRTEIAKAGSV